MGAGGFLPKMLTPADLGGENKGAFKNPILNWFFLLIKKI